MFYIELKLQLTTNMEKQNYSIIHLISLSVLSRTLA